jgi:hypothetical protein
MITEEINDVENLVTITGFDEESLRLIQELELACNIRVLLEELNNMGGNDANIMMHTQRILRSILYDARNDCRLPTPTKRIWW